MDTRRADEGDLHLTPQQKRLWDIADWAKYLAWLALFVFFVYALMQLPAYFGRQYRIAAMVGAVPESSWQLLVGDPAGTLALAANMLATATRGVVYFVVLKGVSLGLRMVLETSLNAQERAAGRETS